MEEEFRFDPREMMTSPWRTCPVCGKDRFGIHIIQAARYLRKCRDCWHGQYYELPPLKKKIIYLDQFVISDLMKLRNASAAGHDKVLADPFWADLNALLFQLRHLQLICCPHSESHEQESRISGFNPQLKQVYEALSGGISFHSFQAIEINQIAELARAWAAESQPTFNYDPRRVLSRNPDQWSERYRMTFGDNPFVVPAQINQNRSQVEAHIARLFFDVWKKENRGFEYWYDLERNEYRSQLGKMWRQSQEAHWKPCGMPSVVCRHLSKAWKK